MSYTTKQTGEFLELVNDYDFLVAESTYDIEKVNFEVILPTDIYDREILFSLDGLNYTDTIEGLEYEVDYDYYTLTGTYDDTLAFPNKLYIRLRDLTVIDKYREVIVASLIGIVLLVIVITLRMIIPKKKK